MFHYITTILSDDFCWLQQHFSVELLIINANVAITASLIMCVIIAYGPMTLNFLACFGKAYTPSIYCYSWIFKYGNQPDFHA